MRHQINDMDLMKLPETMEMAEKIAQNTKEHFLYFL